MRPRLLQQRLRCLRPAAPHLPRHPQAAPAPAAPVRLVGLPAWSALVGNSISGMEDGKPLVEYYAADGTA